MEFNTNEWPEIQASQNSIPIPCRLSAKKGAKIWTQIGPGEQGQLSRVHFPATFLPVVTLKAPQSRSCNKILELSCIQRKFSDRNESKHPSIPADWTYWISTVKHVRGHTFTLFNWTPWRQWKLPLNQGKAPITSLSSSLTALPNDRLIFPKNGRQFLSHAKVPFCVGDKSLTKFSGSIYSRLFHLVTDFKTLAHPKRDCRELQAISPDCRPIPHFTARDAVGEGKPWALHMPHVQMRPKFLPYFPDPS